MPLREPDEAARLAEGWERRFVVEGGRVAEYVSLYESLGFEVVTVPVSPEDAIAECTDCRVVGLLQFRLIYTRPIVRRRM